jgi:hypothetical protein
MVGLQPREGKYEGTECLDDQGSRGPSFGPEQNTLVLPRRVQVINFQRRPVEACLQLGQ